MGRIRSASVALVGLVFGACGDDQSVAPPSTCEFAGITARDASGVGIGPEDPDDWCAGIVSAAPNPASLLTTIRFSLSQDQRVRIRVQGESAGTVRTLTDDDLPAGTHAVSWDMTSDAGTPVPPGIYCVSVSSDEFECTGDVEVRAAPLALGPTPDPIRIGGGFPESIRSPGRFARGREEWWISSRRES